jgi:hypothetical protein
LATIESSRREGTVFGESAPSPNKRLLSTALRAATEPHGVRRPEPAAYPHHVPLLEH